MIENISDDIRHVYIICDPRIKLISKYSEYKPIYVGKGTGNRAYSHIKEALGLKNIKRKNTLKIDMIKDILDSGNQPIIIKIAENLTTDKAFDLEVEVITYFGRFGLDENGILANRIIDQRTVRNACGKKGMKHRKKRSKESRTGTKWDNEHLRNFSTIKQGENNPMYGKIQTKESNEKRSKSSIGLNNTHYSEWEVVWPNGQVEIVKNLKFWCKNNNLNYKSVWGSSSGFKTTKLIRNEMNDDIDDAAVKMMGHVVIKDVVTNEVVVDTFNMVHMENMNLALAQSLARTNVSGVYVGPINEMVFGNGGTSVNGVGVITYLSKNVVGQNATLYNQTYAKVVDQNNPLNVDTTQNFLSVSHVSGNLFSDIVVTCTLEFGEPVGQQVFDTTNTLSDNYVFSELGIINYDGKLLSHVLFSPVQKAQNRTFQIIYSLRLSMI